MLLRWAEGCRAIDDPEPAARLCAPYRTHEEDRPLPTSAQATDPQLLQDSRADRTAFQWVNSIFLGALDARPAERSGSVIIESPPLRTKVAEASRTFVQTVSHELPTLGFNREACPGIEKSKRLARHSHRVSRVRPPPSGIEGVVFRVTHYRDVGAANGSPNSLDATGVIFRSDQDNTLPIAASHRSRNRPHFFRGIVHMLREDSDSFGRHAKVLQHLAAVDVFGRAIDPHSRQRFVFGMQAPARQPNLRRPTRVVKRSSLDRAEWQMTSEYDNGLGRQKRVRDYEQSTKSTYQDRA